LPRPRPRTGRRAKLLPSNSLCMRRGGGCKRRVAAALHGDLIPQESRLTLGTLLAMVETDYAINRRRSLATLRYPLRHLRNHLGEKAKAVMLTGDRLDQYILSRQQDGAANATIRIELALLSKGVHTRRARPEASHEALHPEARG
jgi:hypothetical protein